MAKKEYGTRKKYHFIYKTTNLLSGRYYIGMHSTDDLNDGYLGSGTLLRRSINKHGKENHSIEILEFLNSREELAAREKEIVSLQEIAKKECMNLKVGGSGGNVGKGGEHLGGDYFTAANIFWKTEEGLQKKSEISKRVYKKLLEEETRKEKLIKENNLIELEYCNNIIINYSLIQSLLNYDPRYNKLN